MLKKNAIVILLVVLLTVSSINCLLVCKKDTCDHVKCENATQENCNKPNQDLRKGGFCECCTVCFTTLAENEDCPQLLSTIGGPPPTVACGEGLKCANGKCIK
ncbi:uncharacterized protein LOC123679763 [Harmonia axyridis]|uniref:uncharacterized protein LOC123679763 n=1 Tax=Harmonia axyridis TaxID=115357 RepID=UPI001E274DFF|nr:uncharacterized protein LOC123679763 [Harmonia axyridis]